MSPEYSELVAICGYEELPIPDAARNNAKRFAEALESVGVPCPRIWYHEGCAAVFQWERNGHALYATISAKNLSLLESSPERIVRCMDSVVRFD